MAKSGVRVAITLACTECKRRNYQTMKSKRNTPDRVELLVIDEAERLSPAALEHLRDRFDRRRYGLLLIGMPGIEKGLSRYPQLYSRIGFAHQYRSLGDDELAFVLTRHWKRLGLALDLSDFTDAQAVAAVGRDIPARAAASTASAIGPPSLCAAHRGLLRHSTRMS